MINSETNEICFYRKTWLISFISKIKTCKSLNFLLSIIINSKRRGWKNKTSIKNTSHLIIPKTLRDLETISALYDKDFLVKLFSYFFTLIKAFISCTQKSLF